MPVQASGLARVTIRAPRRRLDLAIPHQVPLAELLPELLRRAGEAPDELAGTPLSPAGGWVLRRGDGASLLGEAALAHQGVRDGDVLFLVPRHLIWPEPAYDDVAEEIAEAARRHGRAWDATSTRLFALVAAGLILLAGLGVLVAVGPGRTIPALVAGGVGTTLLGAGGLLSRALGDALAGAAVGGFALPYAAAGGALLTVGDGPVSRPDQVLVGAGALLLASVVGAAAVGHGLRVFTAGVTTAAFAILGALLGSAVTVAGAAAIVVVTAVAAVGLAPIVAIRLGKLPLPVVSAAPGVLAAERRPPQATVVAAVVRADEILSGALLGISLAGVGCVALLAATTGVAGPLLAGLASAALLLRGRLFPAVAARLPLLTAGVVGLALTSVAAMMPAAPATRLAGATLACVAVVALLISAATVHRRGGGSPYLGRAADILDVGTIVALAPVACAVLGLYGWVRGFGG